MSAVVPIETRLVCTCGWKVIGDPQVVESLGFDHAERCETVKQAGWLYPRPRRWLPDTPSHGAETE